MRIFILVLASFWLASCSSLQTPSLQTVDTQDQALAPGQFVRTKTVQWLIKTDQSPTLIQVTVSLGLSPAPKGSYRVLGRKITVKMSENGKTLPWDLFIRPDELGSDAVVFLSDAISAKASPTAEGYEIHSQSKLLARLKGPFEAPSSSSLLIQKNLTRSELWVTEVIATILQNQGLYYWP